MARQSLIRSWVDPLPALPARHHHHHASLVAPSTAHATPFCSHQAETCTFLPPPPPPSPDRWHHPHEDRRRRPGASQRRRHCPGGARPGRAGQRGEWAHGAAWAPLLLGMLAWGCASDDRAPCSLCQVQWTAAAARGQASLQQSNVVPQAGSGRILQEAAPPPSAATVRCGPRLAPFLDWQHTDLICCSRLTM